MTGSTPATPSSGAYVPDELTYAGAEHLDAGYVAAYDRKQKYDPVPDVEELRRRGLDGSSSLLDMGCGTGTFTLAIAPHCGRVVAADVSPAMVEHLARATKERGVDNVEVVRAGFLSYQHAGDPVDFVFTRNALHQLPDFWKAIALTRLAATMRTGGLLWLRDLVYAFEPPQMERVIEGWFAAAVDDPAEGYTEEDLATHVRTEFSTYSWLLEPMLAHAGFRALDTEVDRRRTYARYACVKL